MGCTKAQLILIIEYIERHVDGKMKSLGIDRERRERVLQEIEKIKQNIVEYGIAEIQRELGL